MLPDVCKTIMRELGLHVFVETGTDSAESVAEVARWFAEMAPGFGRIAGSITTGARTLGAWGTEPIQYPVFVDSGESAYRIFSVDIYDGSYRDVKELLEKNRNIRLIKQSSPAFLKDFVNTDLARRSRLFFFLDAHWGKYWPLRDEIAEVKKLPQYALAIDDFFVPAKSNPRKPRGEFGFDFYGRVILDWGYLRDLFQNEDVRLYYPTRANRDDRGTLFLFKGYDAGQLALLESLGLVCVAKDDPRHINPVPLSPLAYLDAHYLVTKIVPFNLLRRVIRWYEHRRR